MKSRVAETLRLAAQSLWHAQNYFGELYRRWKARLGGPKAITAMAHKLARIVYHLLTTGQAYDETVFAQQEAQNKQRNENCLRQQARKLGFALTLIPEQL